MSSVAPIIVARRMKPDRSWYPFAAGLCLLEAFYCFTVDGRWQGQILDLASSGLPRGRNLLWITMLLRPAVFAAVGVTLWSRHRSLVLIGPALAICLAEIAALWLHQLRFHACVASATGSVLNIARLIEPVIAQSQWFALATIGYGCHRQSRDTPSGGRSAWVVCASAWLIMQGMQAALMPVSGPFASIIVPLPRTLYRLEGLLTGAILAIGAAGLVLQWRHVRQLLVVCTLVATIGGLFYDLRLYDYTFITDGFSQGLPDWSRICMPGWILAFGQWVLVACFALWMPMWQEADDGSPHPRLYCGRCHYNLRGISTQRCPECGTDFTPASSAEPTHTANAG